MSLYPGLVLTESVVANLQYFEAQTNRETPLFVGRVVAALAADPDVMRLTGQWLVAAEVADTYGVVDEHGHRPYSNRAEILGELVLEPAQMKTPRPQERELLGRPRGPSARFGGVQVPNRGVALGPGERVVGDGLPARSCTGPVVASLELVVLGESG